LLLYLSLYYLIAPSMRLSRLTILGVGVVWLLG
jgi:hypothetical protein